MNLASAGFTSFPARGIETDGLAVGETTAGVQSSIFRKLFLPTCTIHCPQLWRKKNTRSNRCLFISKLSEKCHQLVGLEHPNNQVGKKIRPGYWTPWRSPWPARWMISPLQPKPWPWPNHIRRKMSFGSGADDVILKTVRDELSFILQRESPEILKRKGGCFFKILFRDHAEQRVGDSIHGTRAWKNEHIKKNEMSLLKGKTAHTSVCNVVWWISRRLNIKTFMVSVCQVSSFGVVDLEDKNTEASWSWQ